MRRARCGPLSTGFVKRCEGHPHSGRAGITSGQRQRLPASRRAAPPARHLINPAAREARAHRPGAGRPEGPMGPRRAGTLRAAEPAPGGGRGRRATWPGGAGRGSHLGRPRGAPLARLSRACPGRAGATDKGPPGIVGGLLGRERRQRRGGSMLPTGLSVRLPPESGSVKGNPPISSRKSGTPPLTPHPLGGVQQSRGTGPGVALPPFYHGCVGSSSGNVA